jgi:hypothetical protein
LQELRHGNKVYRRLREQCLKQLSAKGNALRNAGATQSAGTFRCCPMHQNAAVDCDEHQGGAFWSLYRPSDGVRSGDWCAGHPTRIMDRRDLRVNGIRHLLRSNAAKALVVLLLVVQGMPLAPACPLVGMDASMAFTSAAMPEACAGLSRQACLASYVQADQAWGNDHPGVTAHLPAILRVASFDANTFAARHQDPAKACAPSGATPPRILFCRKLE